VVVCRCVRYLLQSINFPLTNSPRVHKDEDDSREKTIDEIGRVVVRNTQTILITSGPAGGCASLRQTPTVEYQFSTHKFAMRPQR
jgi:hypothetical protein